MSDSVTTFPSSFYAMRAEKLLQKQQIICKLIPSPRELTSSCAISLLFDSDQCHHVADCFARNKVKYDTIYIYEEVEGQKRKPVIWSTWTE